MVQLSGIKVRTILAVVILSMLPAAAQQVPELEKRITDNYRALRQYSWTMRTQVEVQGQPISTTVEKMRYDLDGELQVTPLGGSGQLTPDMQRLVDALARLAFSYAQPDPRKFQAFIGKTSQWAGQGSNAGTLRIEGQGYLQADDSILILARNQRADQAEVKTSLQGKPVTAAAEYRALPNDGPRYVARLLVTLPSENVEVTVENFDHILNAPVGAGDISTLPVGTELQVRLIMGVSSAKNKKGDAVDATIDKNVLINGKTAVTRGSRIQVVVADAEGSGRVSGRAKMSVTLRQLQSGGKPYPIETNVLSFEADGSGGKDARRVIGGAGIGAIVGAIANGGQGAAIGAVIGGGVGVGATVLTKGKEVELPAETLLSFKLLKPLQLTK